MRTIYFLLLIIILGAHKLNAQLIAGDIAIIGVNEDAGPVGTEDHSFTWIALTDIPAGEVIYFTEQGVNINSMTWFANTEGHYSWTAPGGGLPCGSIVHVYEDGASSEVLVALGGGTMSGVLSGSGWNLSSGDQVLVYQASSAHAAIGSTTFITGIHLNDDLADGETNGWTTTAYNSTGVAQCHLPPGLTDGVNCISLYSSSSPENDNNKYIGTLTGTSTVLRALINSPFPSGNWYGDSGTNATVGISVGDYSPSVTCIPLSTNTFEFENKIKIYPNPSSSYIEISGLTKNINYKVYNTLGTEISKGTISNNEKINIENYSKGFYLLIFDNGSIIKFIKV